MDRLSNSNEILPDELRRIDAICDQFEVQLLQGDNPPDIEGLVSAESNQEMKSYLLGNLVPLEVEYSGNGFTNRNYQRYLEQFPEFSNVIDKLFDSHDLTHIVDDLQKTVKSTKVQDPILKLMPGEQIGKYQIINCVGAGSFGVVYQAKDKELQRDVALKVARYNKAEFDRTRERFVVEAQVAAKINADGIATIYDLYRDDDRICIVQEFVEGSNLSQAIAKQNLTINESIQLTIDIANAISHAHELKIYHRDLKPGNVIIDRNGKPTLVDFGLAWQAKRLSSRSHVCGTPNYMSPEQVRGENNRTDATTDVWALGIILYELLVGCRPFDRESTEETFQAIQTSQPKPLTEFNSNITPELNRIVLKCISKKKSERYSSAKQLANDLQRFSEAEESRRQENTQWQEINVVPKGLRSFSHEDSNFYLGMLPGPRDYQGIPESILFWKSRIENLGAFDVFPVGLIYGESGCGKSSFVKAGLIPLLADEIKVVYVESNQLDTEIRLIRSLRNLIPELQADLSLPDAIASVRDGDFLDAGEKLLIVVDQFEQWLAANGTDNDCQLSNALRHCDGGTIQSLLLVRNEYWPQAGGFMSELEVPLSQNSNCRSIELFDHDHASRILFEFGRAFGRFDSVKPNENEQEFVDKVVSELSDGGKVIGVRLAMFAEAFRGKKWTTESLGQFGGPDGVGVAFLNDTFLSAKASSIYRSHANAAQSCLQALLPETKSNLKGNMQSRESLLTKSGYDRHEERFEQLISILDQELRLVTATNPIGSADEEPGVDESGRGEHYQLSHDYLVPILRKWIDTEQQRHFAGRIQSRMSQVTSIWGEVPDKRYLPTWTENFSFLWFTKWNSWSTLQRQMMNASLRHHLLRTLIFGTILCVAIIFGIRAIGDYRASQTVEQIKHLALTEVEPFVENLHHRKTRLRPILDREMGALLVKKSGDAGQRGSVNMQKVNVAIANAKLNDCNWNEVTNSLFDVPKEQISVIANLVSDRHEKISKEFERLLSSNPNDRSERALRMALALGYWGSPDPLMEFAVSAQPSELGEIALALSVNSKDSCELLNRRVARASAELKIPPSDSLSVLFAADNGVIHGNGALVVSMPLSRSRDLLLAAFDEGYLPLSFRPFYAAAETMVSIAWCRSSEFVGEDYDDCIVYASGLTDDELGHKNQMLENRGWRTTDISFFNDPSNQFRSQYSGVWTRNDAGLETILDLSISDIELLINCETNSHNGFQIERMFTKASRVGSQLFSVVWTRDPGNWAKSDSSRCWPEFDFAIGNEIPTSKVNAADCQIAEKNLSVPSLFDVSDLAEKSRVRIHEYLADPEQELSSLGAEHVAQYAKMIFLLGRKREAVSIFDRLVADYPETASVKSRGAYLYSLSNDKQKLDIELERIVKIGITKGVITKPLFRFRYAVQNGNFELATELLHDLLAAVEKSKLKYKNNPEIIDELDRSLVRAKLIQTAMYESGSPQDKKLKEEALELLCSTQKRNIWFLLFDADFDVIRDELRFRSFIKSRGYGHRVTRSSRLEQGLETFVRAGKTVENTLTSSNEFLLDGFQPRCIATAEGVEPISVYSEIVWERRNGKTDLQMLQLRRSLANSAILMAELDQRDLLNRILNQRLGKNLQEMIRSEYNGEISDR